VCAQRNRNQGLEQLLVCQCPLQHYNSQGWKQPRGPSADEGRNEIWCIYAIEYYSALKRKEILTHATTWMNLEDVVPDTMG